jgi:hypothetical protein
MIDGKNNGSYPPNTASVSRLSKSEPRNARSRLEEDSMRNRFTLISISLGIAAGLVLANPTITSLKTSAAPTSETIDVSQMQRNASMKALPSFDDHYQIYIGILDVLRPHPGP